MKREQLLFEHWQDKHIRKMAKSFDMSLSKIVRFIVCHFLLNAGPKEFTKITYDELEFKARKMVE